MPWLQPAALARDRAREKEIKTSLNSTAGLILFLNGCFVTVLAIAYVRQWSTKKMY